MKKVTRIILWGAWYGSKNLGDQALLLSITDLLGEGIKDAEFVVITANPALVREYTKMDSSYSFIPLHIRKQFLAVIKAFSTADLFVFGGGVPFYDDLFHSIVMAAFISLSLIFKVSCVLWSVSSLRIRSSFSKLMIRYVLSWASVITCRDRHTYELFKECGACEDQLQIVADSAFTLRSNEQDATKELLARAGWNPRQVRSLVALTPRLLRTADGEAHTHYSPQTASESEKETDIFAGVLDWLWENGYQPIFVPMNTIAPDDDRIAFHKIITKAKFGKKAFSIDEEIFPRDAANVYRYCQAAFVARVHGAITAFLGECPMLMYAFDFKHKGIMEQMNLSDSIFEPDHNTPDEAIRMISQILTRRMDLVARMKEENEVLRERARIPRDAALRLLQQK